MNVPPAGRRMVSLDLDSGVVHLQNLQTPELTVDQLDVRVPQAPHLVESMISIQSALSGQMPSLQGLAGSPMQVESGRIRLPESTVNRAMQEVGKDIFAQEGLRDVKLAFEEGNRLAVTGSVHRLVDIPFSLEGRLSLEGSNELRFSLDKARALGFLPVPRLVTDLFSSLAARGLEQAHIRQEGHDYLVNAGAFLPANLQVNLSSVATHDGYLVAESQ